MKTAAASVEETTAPISHAVAGIGVEHHDERPCNERGRDDDAHGGERARRAQDGDEATGRDRQPTVEQDRDQRQHAEVLSQLASSKGIQLSPSSAIAIPRARNKRGSGIAELVGQRRYRGADRQHHGGAEDQGVHVEVGALERSEDGGHRAMVAPARRVRSPRQLVREGGPKMGGGLVDRADAGFGDHGRQHEEGMDLAVVAGARRGHACLGQTGGIGLALVPSGSNSAVMTSAGGAPASTSSGASSGETRGSLGSPPPAR